MGLSEYRKKRAFNKTPEPEGGTPDADTLRFVIQKHAASHLHYDFRLEVGGVLVSWAVPKGLSTDPDVKRLAMQVEDHPFDYRNFEGTIPAGEYGGGTVIIWDEGTYEPTDSAGSTKAALEKTLRAGLRAGKLTFVLDGIRLKGEFHMVKTKGRGENAWLIFKAKDKHASIKDVTLKTRSVRSGKTIAQLAKSADENKSAAPAKKTAAPKSRKSSATGRGNAVRRLLAKAPASDFPEAVSPMLATLSKNLPRREGLVFEVKWDGYRAIAGMNGPEVRLYSRNNKDFAEKFYPVFHAVSAWGIRAVTDGEIVVLNEKGVSSFAALQNWRSEADGDLYYYVFDLLWLDGKDLTGLPLSERQAVLRTLVPPAGDVIRLSESFRTGGEEFLASAEQLGLEGIMAKDPDSPYRIGERSSEWQKVKISVEEEVIIGGFTRNADTGKLFSSLLVGSMEKGELVYKGKIGTGFTAKVQAELLEKFRPLIRKRSPFASLPDVNKPSRFRPDPPRAEATWLKPELTCRVKYTELTEDGVMRHPAFGGLAGGTTKKKTARRSTPAKEKKTAVAKKVVAPAAKRPRATLLNPTEETQVRKVNGQEMKFGHLSKLYWPDEKISKRDLLNYYYAIAPVMLPYLKDRPMSLNRFPDGIKGQGFYQKDITGKAPDWLETMPYTTDEDDRQKNFLVCTNEASLLYMASIGTIEMNPWSSTVQHPDHPDWCIIDLDPAKNPFNQVIEAANVTRQILDAIGAPSVCKTSGSTGLHIYIPLRHKYTYEQSKEFARVVATLVQAELPAFTSIERIISKRRGKMYIDFLQNRPGATLAAPYSVRPKPGATVSMPLHWEEVRKGLKMTDFTIENALARVREEGDLFGAVLGKGIDLPAVLKKLHKITGAG